MRAGAGPEERVELRVEPGPEEPLWSRMGGPALCGLAALAAATAILLLAVVHSRGGSVEREAWPAAPLFRGASRVVDLPLGQLDWAERLRADAEVCVLVLYAPWCARCVRAVPHVDRVAHALAGQVLFIAVNCWWPKGRCRREMSFSFFPAIHIYHTGLGPIPYEGPLLASYLQAFVERVMVPVTHVATPHHLLDFLATSEPGILGFFEFNASPQPPGYLEFYRAALLSLQRDGTAPMRFGVLTSGGVAQLAGLVRAGSVCMPRLFNSTAVFTETGAGATAETLYRWAAGARQPPPLQWLRPSGRKSLLLNTELRKGPALILFLPFRPLRSDGHELLHMAEELALEYHNCECSDAVSLLTRHLRGKQRGAEPEPPATSAPCCSCLLPPWGCPLVACELCALPPVTSCPVSLPALATLPPAAGGRATCDGLRAQDGYGTRRFSLCCRQLGRAEPGSQTGVPGPLAGGLGGGSCDGAGAVAALRGLRCRTNRTLRFYAMDSELHWEFAERLGAPSPPAPSLPLTFVTIVSVEQEQHHVLRHNHTVNRTQLVEFVEQFSRHHSNLQRHLSSGCGVARPPPTSARPPLVIEVTTTTFRELVLDPAKDVLLLYYTTWCGLCSTLSHRYLQLASQLRHNGHLRIARINGDTNDLPWEFVVERYPTLLLFPAHRKDMSVRYPDEAPFSLPELGRFLVRHASGAARERLAASTSSGEREEQQQEQQQQQQQAELHQQQREAGRLRESARALAATESRLRGRVSALRRERGRLRRDVRHLGRAAQRLRQRWGGLRGHGDLRGDLHRGDAALAFQSAVRALSAENSVLKLYIAALERKVTALLARRQQQQEGDRRPNKRQHFHEHYQRHQRQLQQQQRKELQKPQQQVPRGQDEHRNHYERPWQEIKDRREDRQEHCRSRHEQQPQQPQQEEQQEEQDACESQDGDPGERRGSLLGSMDRDTAGQCGAEDFESAQRSVEPLDGA
ncbi:thioredoxin domain-containing protein 11 [Lampetra planeri]